MEFVQLTDTEFTNYTSTSPVSSIFQTLAWATLKANWQAYTVGVKKDGEIVAACLILCRSLPLGFKFAYAPRGPLLDVNNKELFQFFMTKCKQFLRSKHVVLAKFDPNIVIAEIPFEEKEKVATIKNDELIKQFKQAGLVHQGYTLAIKESIQPRIQLSFPVHTVIEEQIPTKTMKKVRASYNKNVIIKEEHDAKSLVAMVQCTEQRHHIKLRNETYFNTILDAFKDDACVLAGYHEGQLISACLLVKCNTTTEILYSGYDDNYKQFNSTYPLRYESIQWAKQHGCKEFSFGGVEGTLDDGLTMFKSSFRPLIHVFVGEFDCLPLPIISKVVSLCFPYLKKYVI